MTFLLTFHSSHRPFLYHFQDIAKYRPKKWIFFYPFSIEHPRTGGVTSFSWNGVTALRRKQNRVMGVLPGSEISLMSFFINLDTNKPVYRTDILTWQTDRHRPVPRLHTASGGNKRTCHRHYVMEPMNALPVELEVNIRLVHTSIQEVSEHTYMLLQS